MKGVNRNSLIFLLVLICFLFCWSPRTVAQQETEKNVCFRWAFGAMVGSKDDRRLVAITRDTILKTGDKLKMFMELQKKCFVYLIYHTSQDELLMLFPYDIQQFTTDYKLFNKYYIPQNNIWFELDEKVGRETFYLLASAQRLFELEKLYVRYYSSGPGKKQELAKQILTKIRDIKKRRRKFTASAERPVSIGGRLRGVIKEKKATHPDIEPIAEQVSAIDFYSRTFTIDHQ